MPAEFRYDGAVRSVVGDALPGLSVAVLSQPAVTSTQPGSPLVALFAAAVSNAATLTSASWVNGVMTLVFSGAVPADVVAGAYVRITGVNPAGYNSVWQVVSVSGLNVVVTTPFTLAIPANPGVYVSGGTVGTSALPNPFFTDNLGNFNFYAPVGVYTVQVYDTLGRLAAQLVFPDQPVIAGGAGAGSVTSVGLTGTAEMTITGSPVSTSGTLAIAWQTQNAHLFFCGPTTGGAVTPTFRAMVASDLPAGTGTVTSVSLTLAVPAALLSAAVTGSPLTTAGTLGLTVTLVNQNANFVFAGPTSGGAGQPAFRALVLADLPGAGLQYLQTSSTTLSAANLLALLGTPISLVPAPGVGFTLHVLSIVIVFFGGAAAYTDAGGAVSFAIGSASQALASNGIFLVTTTPNKAIQRVGALLATDTAGNPPTDDNAALTIQKATNNFAAGNGTAKVIVHYLVLPTT